MNVATFTRRCTTIALLAIVFIGVPACGTDSGSTPDTPVMFSAAPSDCSPVVADVATQIARFTGDLYSADLQYQTGGVDDPPRTETLTCSGSYPRTGGDVAGSNSAQVKLRTVYLGFTVTTSDLGLEPGYRLRLSEDSFTRSRPDEHTRCDSIGEDCYIVTETTPGTISTALHFRSRNLNVLVRLSTSTQPDMTTHPDTMADSVHAREIARVLADDLDDIVPR
ncbi:hypothetical protein [Nocardia arizonensis]|uniref:hypothetical protein n=1 Tax=Nocardia arizonensis TaxID=1141647 RepID=UPI0006CFEFCE|nr:hypothetical protein [Nocardia arizonensis]